MPHGERINTLTHLIGTIFAVLGSILLIFLSYQKNDLWKMFSFAVYGATTVWLYFSSTLYHGSLGGKKELWRKFDFTGIYLKIAGNYTPYMLITLAGLHGWAILSFVWTLAFIGICQELLIGKRTRKYSMYIYIAMASAVTPALSHLFNALPRTGFALVMAGFFCYCIGLYFYINDEKIKHGHGIWHICVLGGSTFQYLCLLFYVV